VSDLKWSVDSLIVRDNAYFGFGWIFDLKREITDLWFLIKEDGKTHRVATDFGKPRDDVAASFPSAPFAPSSGYLIFGSPDSEVLGKVTLALGGKYADGALFEVEIPERNVIYVDNNAESRNRLVRSQFFSLLKRGLVLLKHGKVSSLAEKARRYLRGRPRVVMDDVQLFSQKLQDSEKENVSLIIDHDLGGGANDYRHRMVADKIASGTTVLIFTYHVATLSYVLIVKNARLDERFSISGYDFISKLAARVPLKELIYNTAVSFVRPSEVPQSIVELKRKYNLRLVVLVHDFFIVCPSHFLLDDQGKYCGIPEISRCQDCLQNNQQGFSSLFQARDMKLWRGLWGGVISAADEIQTFSNNSRTLLQKAYPSLDEIKVTVKPHRVDHLPPLKVHPSSHDVLTIGIVGRIGYHKGSKFVQQLAQEIKRRKLDVKIVVIGTVETNCDTSVLQQTGPYSHDQLGSLIASSGANIMFFSSIWPETFSYVVQELIEMGLPVASFNLGAPAERLASYSKGLVIDGTDLSVVLDQLLAFHKRIYITH
jgi:glycosyltransferase involved in cell wall biosynthesis